MSIDILSTHQLNIKAQSVSVHNGINMNNSRFINVPDAVNLGDVVTKRQLNSIQFSVPDVIIIDALNGHYDISSYHMVKNNALIVLNPNNSNYYVKLPSPTSLLGLQLNIVNSSVGSGVLSLCIDNYTVSLKDIAPNDNGLKIISIGSRYLFLQL